MIPRTAQIKYFLLLPCFRSTITDSRTLILLFFPNCQKMLREFSFYGIILVCVAAVVVFVVAIVVINSKSKKTDDGAININGIQVVPTHPCDSSLNIASFEKLQTFKSSEAPNPSSSFGEAMAVGDRWLVVAENGATLNTTILLFYSNINFENPKLPPNYIFLSSINLAGRTPLLAMSRRDNSTYLAVAVTTATDNAVLHEYVNSSGTWVSLASTDILDPITSLSKFCNLTAYVSKGETYVSGVGIELATFSHMNSISVAIDGDSSGVSLLIGTKGAVYLYTKTPSETVWGFPIKSYLGTNEKFGEFVDMNLPYFTISDYDNVIGMQDDMTQQFGQTRLLFYTTKNLVNPKVMILLDEALRDEYTSNLFGNGVVINTNTSASVYAPTKGIWSQTYCWNFTELNTPPVVVSTYCPVVAAKMTTSATSSEIATYIQAKDK